MAFIPPSIRAGLALLALAGPAAAQAPAPSSPAPATAQPSGPAAAQPADRSPDKPLARVHGATIVEGDVAVAADDPALQLSGMSMSEAQKHDLLVGYLIDLKLGAKAAEAAKVGEGQEFARKLAYFRDKLLLDEYMEREVKKAVTPEAARALYDETVKTMRREQEVRARPVLVKTEDEAKKAAARLKGGEDFGKVAGEASKDPG